MTLRVDIQPALLSWARRRARLSPAVLAKRFPRLGAWESGDAKPTLRQAEDFAQATHTPLGLLFLPEPPVETVPIPDFRTLAAAGVTQPSADLLDTIYACQQRQDWYREFARSSGEDRLAFVGSLASGGDIVAAAQTIRDALHFDLEARRRAATSEEALRDFVRRADEAGVLVMCSGIVGSDTHRKLDPEEFRGFAMADEYAPVVFVNGADSKSAQMFTLAHELVHVWIGETALSDSRPREAGGIDVERWCNAVAAELLVPLEAFRVSFDLRRDLESEVSRMARQFKVSTLVILRRVHDIGALTRDQFWTAYDAEVARLRVLRNASGGGGDFHRSTASRVSGRFARAIVASAVEGQTLYRDAMRMLGMQRMETFQTFGRFVGVIA
jgi:Zn-dependent peptidase ImmA (M78 family)